MSVKHRNKILLVSALISSSPASAEAWFFGGSIGSSNIEMKQTLTLLDTTSRSQFDEKGISYSIRWGGIQGGNHRTYFSVSGSSSGLLDAYHMAANYEYLIHLNESFNLFAGAHIGVTGWEFKELDVDESGTARGFQIGADYKLAPNMSLGLEYRVNFPEAKRTVNTSDLNITTSLDLYQEQNVYLTFHYLY